MEASVLESYLRRGLSLEQIAAITGIATARRSSSVWPIAD
jgi:hypothetical protein